MKMAEVISLPTASNAQQIRLMAPEMAARSPFENHQTAVDYLARLFNISAKDPIFNPTGAMRDWSLLPRGDFNKALELLDRAQGAMSQDAIVAHIGRLAALCARRPDSEAASKAVLKFYADEIQKTMPADIAAYVLENWTRQPDAKGKWFPTAAELHELAAPILQKRKALRSMVIESQRTIDAREAEVARMMQRKADIADGWVPEPFVPSPNLAKAANHP
jgi:hypothetical protein